MAAVLSLPPTERVFVAVAPLDMRSPSSSTARSSARSTAKKRRRKSSASPETRSESIGNDSFVASRRTSSAQRARPIGAAVHDELAAHTRHMEAPRLRIAGFFCCLDCGAEGDRTPDLI